MIDRVQSASSLAGAATGLADVGREIAEAASPSRSYFIMTGLAAVLAGYGLLANSPAVIIGAMLVAMLLNPITGLSFALATGDTTLLRRAATAELLGGILVFVIGCVVALVNDRLPVTDEMINRADPGLLDLVIALAGGAAVAYATGNARMNAALAGVAIATSLVPPLADSGMLLIYGQPRLALGAFLLFANNYATILFAASGVFWLLGYRSARRTQGGALISAVRLVQLAVFAGLATLLALRFEHQVQSRLQGVRIEEGLQDALKARLGARLIEVRIAPSTAPDRIVATVRTPRPLTPADIAQLERALPADVTRGLRLRVRSVPVVVAESGGYRFQEDDLP